MTLWAPQQDSAAVKFLVRTQWRIRRVQRHQPSSIQTCAALKKGTTTRKIKKVVQIAHSWAFDYVKTVDDALAAGCGLQRRRYAVIWMH